MQNNKKSVFQAMVSVSGIIVIAKILGFVKRMVTANAFGATIQTDLISISEDLITNIDYLLIQTLSTAFVPTYIVLNTKNPKDSKRFTSNVIKVFLIITMAVALTVIAIGPVIAKILAPSYTPELTARLTVYIRIFAPCIIILIELAVFNSLLKANEIFVPGEMVSIHWSIILISLVLIIGNVVGPDTIVIGFYGYAIFNLIFLTIVSRKYWRIERGNPFKDPAIRQMLKMMGPLILGYSALFINQQVDKIIVSGMSAGTITAMSYATVLSNLITTYMGSLCGVLFTYITKHVAEKADEDASELALKSLKQLVTLLLPISVLTVMNAHDIVTIVFGHGKFDDTAINSCSLALIGYGCIFVPYILREMFNRFQYAYGDSKRPMINSAISIALNIVLSIILSRWLGVLGVTLATSISVLLCGLLNILSARKKNQYLKFGKLLKSVPQWLIGAVLCVTVSILGQNLLSQVHTLIRFAAITVTGLAIYALINFSAVKSLIKGVLHKG